MLENTKKLRESQFAHRFLIAIPGVSLLEQIKIRSEDNNEKFKTEYNVNKEKVTKLI